MKRLVYSQRVEIVTGYGERRDCADVDVAKLIWACGYIPIPINNIPKKTRIFLKSTDPDGVILTGGNDLAKYGGNAPERDETEEILIGYAMEKNIPLYGFCRGMQMIADYFGARLKKVENHVAVKHVLEGNHMWNGRRVNSYHNMAVDNVTENLIVEARAQDGVIEAFKIKNRKIYGTMWHPERENPYDIADIAFIKKLFL